MSETIINTSQKHQLNNTWVVWYHNQVIIIGI